MATAADILGINLRTKVPLRWVRHYERLCDERDKLLQRDYSNGEVGATKHDDLGDAASQESERSLTLVAASAAKGTIVEILEAIKRIERGTYGICEITGEAIATERLNSIPWTRYSYEGQQQLEQLGKGRSPGLPVLEGLSHIESADT